MKQFDESIKPAFRSREDEDQYINFPMANLKDNPAKNIKSNCITLTGATLYEIFSPVFREIDKLVTEQVNMVHLKRVKQKHPKESIKAIFLVGGFGSSAYLRQAIATAHPEIQVIQPDDAWSAIVRGAILSQLPQEATVVTSIAPKHYGVSGFSIHDPVRDVGKRKCYDPYEDTWRTETMTWYIKKDDDILRSREIQFPFNSRFAEDVPAEDLVIESILLECEVEKEPLHPTKGVTLQNCTLTTDLNQVPRDLFQKKKSKAGENYIELNFKLIVSVAAKMTFTLQVAGKAYGQVVADY